MGLKLNVASLEDEVEGNEKDYHALYLKRQAFDDSMIELELLGNHFLDEALDNPEMEKKIKELTFQIRKLVLSHNIAFEIDFKKIKK